MERQQFNVNSRLPPSRGRLKKGKTLSKRKTVQEVMVEQQEVCTKLPNITTTQLVRLPAAEPKRHQCENAWRKEKENWAKPRKFTRTALKTESFKTEDADELNGLIVSSINNKNQEYFTASKSLVNFSSPNLKSKTGRLSKTETDDSGFGEEPCEFSTNDNNISLKSHCSGIETSISTFYGTGKVMDIRRLKTRGSPNDSQLVGRCPPKLVIRKNYEKTDLQARMCTQSHLSLHSDLMALKNLTIHKRSQREKYANCAKGLEISKTREDEKVFKLASISSPGLSDPSFSILKKKQSLLSRKSSGIESVSVEEQTININLKVKFEQIGSKLPENETKKCVRFNLDNFETTSDCGVENQSYSDLSPRSSSLTPESLREAVGNHRIMDVNSKCEEWLNRWLESVNGSQILLT